LNNDENKNEIPKPVGKPYEQAEKSIDPDGKHRAARAVKAETPLSDEERAERAKRDEERRAERAKLREERRVEREKRDAEEEARLRTQLRADCITACETWPVRQLRTLETTVSNLALAGVLTESVVASVSKISDEKSATAVLAELLAERKVRETLERERRENDERENTDENRVQA